MMKSQLSFKINQFQQHGYSLEKLPVSIFSEILEYISDQNYLFFMNCNRYLHNGIKPEKVRYRAKGKYDENCVLIDDEITYHNIQDFQFLMTKVQYPKRQLRLFIETQTSLIINKYAPLFTNIYHLKIEMPLAISNNLTDDFDFSIFNNIYRVKLFGFCGVKTISKGLENIQELEISDFRDLESIECPLIGFKKFTLARCGKLQSLSEFQRTKEINIDENTGIGENRLRNLNLSTTKDHLESLKFRLSHGTSGDPSIIQGIDFESLKSLSLVQLAFSYCDFSIFLWIPSLSISCKYFGLPHLELYIKLLSEFPIFYGKYLRLFGFSLSSYKSHYILENLIELTLDSCTNFPRLPILPNVRKIHLSKMKEIEEIFSNSLPNCICMELLFCSSLVKVNRLPKLKTLKISCSKLICFSGFHGDENNPPIILNSLYLTQLPSFTDISSMPATYQLTISGSCIGIRSFDGFDRSILPSSQRKVTLEHFNAKDCDLQGLGNIHELRLISVRDLIDGKGIHDVEIMFIDNSGLENFTNFHRIQCCHLSGGNMVKSFDGLQSTPRIIVTLSHLTLQNFRGLMNGGQVYFHVGVNPFCGRKTFLSLGAEYESPFIKEAKNYATAKEKSSSCYSDVFESIREFYVINDVLRPPHFSSFENIVRLW